MIFLGGHLAIVDLLLDAGGEFDYADLGGMTPLLHSVHQGSIIKLLKYLVLIKIVLNLIEIRQLYHV